jgi:hypothetical protein
LWVAEKADSKVADLVTMLVGALAVWKAAWKAALWVE